MPSKNQLLRRLAILICWVSPAAAPAEEAHGPVRVLIIDGRNNHDWQVTSDALRSILKSSGRFEIDIETAPEQRVHRAPRRPRKGAGVALVERYEAAQVRHRDLVKASRPDLDERWSAWDPDFSKYGAVVVNYNGPTWPQPMRESFVDYVKAGGGAVFVHAANNAFGNWVEFNKMIGMGWRKKIFGRALKIDPNTGATIWDRGAGDSGHGSKHPFQVAVRAPGHPIMDGLPPLWMHGKDELYHDMRGPAENLTILSSAFSDPDQGGTGKHEPITWEVKYGE
ncbi:MAG: ThuA domain-containing protein, partial [Verrucomicrobiales bacterium]